MSSLLDRAVHSLEVAAARGDSAADWMAQLDVSILHAVRALPDTSGYDLRSLDRRLGQVEGSLTQTGPESRFVILDMTYNRAYSWPRAGVDKDAYGDRVLVDGWVRLADGWDNEALRDILQTYLDLAGEGGGQGRLYCPLVWALPRMSESTAAAIDSTVNKIRESLIRHMTECLEYSLASYKGVEGHWPELTSPTSVQLMDVLRQRGVLHVEYSFCDDPDLPCGSFRLVEYCPEPACRPPRLRVDFQPAP